MSFVQITNIVIILLMLSMCIQGTPISNDQMKTEEEILKFRNTLSNEIRKYMNESSDPCENFYEFSCGKWKQYYPANSSVHFTSMQENIYEVFKNEIMQFLSTNNENDTESDRKVKNFYTTCSKTNFKERDDRADILKKIINEFGQMPALVGDDWKEDNFDWLLTVAEIANKYNIGIIVGMYKYTSSRQANDLFMISPDLSPEYDAEAEIKKASNIFEKYLFLNESASLEIATEICSFEQALWEICDEEMVAIQEAPYIESFVKEHTTDVNLMKFVNVTYGYIPSHIKIGHPMYVKALGGILTKFPKKVVANYIFYKLISEFMKLFNSDCYSLMETHFINIMSNMYYRLKNAKDMEEDWKFMWLSIKSTLQMILESKKLSWLDDDSIEYFLEKLHSMQMMIASFKEYNFDEFYATLTTTDDDYIENMKSIMIFRSKWTRDLITVMPRLMEDVNMFTPLYMANANTMIIPASYFAMNFYGSDMSPNAINYARMGTTFTHELFHGLSGGGQYYDKLGYSLSNYQEEIEDEFEKRVQCFYDQYHNYTFDGKPLGQDESQSENTADNGGVILAYEDYLRWYADSDRTLRERDMETLPNLNYTNKQLYFITYAQGWCNDLSEEGRAAYGEDVHSPAEFRAYVPLSNYREFSKEFNCPKGSAMNPQKKCYLN